MDIREMLDLSDKVALVTGGGNGIGCGCAHALAQAGAVLFLAASASSWISGLVNGGGVQTLD